MFFFSVLLTNLFISFYRILSVAGHCASEVKLCRSRILRCAACDSQKEIFLDFFARLNKDKYVQ